MAATTRLLSYGYVSLFVVRLTILVVWGCSDYFATAYQTVIWPCLGLLFMPLTTLAYAWGWHHRSESLVVVIAALLDLCLFGTSEWRNLGPWFRSSRDGRP
jgi:hypothetical protein